MTIRVHIDGRVHEVEPGQSVAAVVLNAAGAPRRLGVPDGPGASGVSDVSAAACAPDGPGVAFRRSANGQPRGPICGMGICHECRLTIDDVPHERSCLIECRDGMNIRTAEDPGDRNGSMGDWSAKDRSPEDRSPEDRSPEIGLREAAGPISAHLDTDVLILGGGPAGLAAAAALADHSVETILIDENPSPGGQIWRRSVRPPHQEDRANKSIRSAIARSTFLGSTTVWDIQPRECRAHCGAWQGQVGREAYLRVRFRRVLLASGARERFLPFPGWTLPGVMGVGGAQALAKSGWDVSGLRIVVAGSGPLLPAVASSLRQRGAEIRLLAEQASRSNLLPMAAALLTDRTKLRQAVRLRMDLGGVRWRFGTWPVRAEGDGHVQSVVMTDGRSEWKEECDLLAVGFGLVPNVEAALQLGCRLSKRGLPGVRREFRGRGQGGVHCGVQGGVHDKVPGDAAGVAVDPWQETSVAGVYAAGEVTGVGGVDLAEAEGRIAGLAMAGERAAAEEHFQSRARGRAFAAALDEAFALRRELLVPPDDAVTICRCEDVAFGQVASHESWRAAKLATRCGMGSCQGRVCGAALRTLKGWIHDVPRPPLSPVPVGAWIDDPEE